LIITFFSSCSSNL